MENLLRQRLAMPVPDLQQPLQGAEVVSCGGHALVSSWHKMTQEWGNELSNPKGSRAARLPAPEANLPVPLRCLDLASASSSFPRAPYEQCPSPRPSEVDPDRETAGAAL